MDASNVANRAWSIDAWLFGADSVLPWLAIGPDEAFDKAEAAEQAVFYPGKRFDHNGFVGSLRMKAFRDGQQDVECLILLAKQLGATRKDLAGPLGASPTSKALSWSNTPRPPRRSPTGR